MMDESVRKELMRLCGVRNTEAFARTSVSGQKMSGICIQQEALSDQEKPVCSVQERKLQEENRVLWQEDSRKELEEDDTAYFSGGTWNGEEAGNGWSDFLANGINSLKSGKGAYGKGEEAGTGSPDGETGPEDGQHEKNPDKIKRIMIRNYVLREFIHEEGKNDPESHFKLIKRLFVHELTKPLQKLGRLLTILLLRIAGAVVAVVLQAVLVLIPLLALLYLLLSPVSFFRGLFDNDETVMENPQNIRKAVQELYVAFQGEIDAFQSADGNNQVTYTYGKYEDSQMEEILAVYVSVLCTSEGYWEMDSDSGYPPYLLVDTYEEKLLLEEVFRQFNYTEKEGITVHGMNDNGVEWEAQAEKMTVTCLTIGRWKDKYLSGMPEKTEKLLEQIWEQIEKNREEGGDFASGGSVPITDIKIPDHLDENLVYMAGFLKAEAGNQPYQGKIAVAYVMLNRAGGSSGNIKGILTAPYQFSCYIPYHTVEKYLKEYTEMTDEKRARDSCWQAASAAYYGTAENPIGGMKYYCNPKYCTAGEEEQWRRIRAKNSESEIRIIGDHVFCQNCW